MHLHFIKMLCVTLASLFRKQIAGRFRYFTWVEVKLHQIDISNEIVAYPTVSFMNQACESDYARSQF